MTETMAWWLSSEKMTIEVTTQQGKIIEVAPIAKKFVGQPLPNLIAWMQKQKGFRIERLLHIR